MEQPPPTREVNVQGKALVCPVCENRTFWQRRTLMNTRGLSFFNWDWANRDAVNEICARCGYVYWFMQ